jgi:hypothetical protein
MREAAAAAAATQRAPRPLGFSLLRRWSAAYAASGAARARASACDSRASITRSAWSATRSIPRTRSGASPRRQPPRRPLDDHPPLDRDAVAIDHRPAERRLDPRLPGGVQGDERLDAVRGPALAPRVDHRRAASAAFTAAIVLAAI